MKKTFLAASLFLALGGTATASNLAIHNTITRLQQLNPTTVEILFEDGNRMVVDFYAENIFRLFLDTQGGIVRDPEASPQAQILVKNPRTPLMGLKTRTEGKVEIISNSRIELTFNRETSLMEVKDLVTGKTVLHQLDPIYFHKGKTTLTFQENDAEYFYGGGMQNGRFSHKGQLINIENENSWTDGGVASPNPFFWSTEGYGIMFHTFKRGKYDFGKTRKGVVELTHETPYLDVFIMVDNTPTALLRDFYQLTGNPVLLPKFGFYEGHLNAYNRDYWKEDENGILFEDGKRYKESQKDNGGIKESLNGEKNNYQFSARAVVDRYKANDMPLGWILPNDGYGAGYGQAETLDGNIQNLKSFGEYARKNGVEIGLWTQSDLHPKEGISALLQRDIVKEVRDAGVRVLKTDVAWVGSGYSFGLNGVTDVGEIMPYYGNDARPFIISLDGWAGTQRYATVWSGDQTGGDWEYIRFHIPTYLGSSLSGQPNNTSDMDGIFGGKNWLINTRDFQWKTFTPMELNMDGWGSNEKYPHALGEPATSVNRMYLKMKSQFLPYMYTYAHEAVNGLPYLRPMFLEEKNAYTLGTATNYQFMLGDYLLVAPIYQNTKADEAGNDIRNGIYLPAGLWIDYFTGETYEGGKVINNFKAPYWKLPLFVKAGAILPQNNANNQVKDIQADLRIVEFYPSTQRTNLRWYDDDGTTQQYLNGVSTETLISSEIDAKGNAILCIAPTTGSYIGFQPEKTTHFIVNVTAQPKSLTAMVNGKKVKLTAVSSLAELADNTYYYEETPNLNKYATAGTDFEKVVIRKNPQLHIQLAKANVSTTEQKVILGGYTFTPTTWLQKTGTLAAPEATVTEPKPFSLTPSWNAQENADYYEILYDGMVYSTIHETSLTFGELKANTSYTFQVRSVNKAGVSPWTTIQGTTTQDPLLYAIHGIHGSSPAPDEEELEIFRLFDFATSGDIWYIYADKMSLPYPVTADLRGINTLDKMQFLPRFGSGGTILEGYVETSLDGENWTNAGRLSWERNDETKEFIFTQKPQARYVRMVAEKTYGNNVSGREWYIFREPGTEAQLSGDINNDKKLDNNDLTSYMNYTGLRQGDADFEGYISRGDINNNGLIDAFDISNVAIHLEEGVNSDFIDKLGGKLEVKANKTCYKKDEIIEIQIQGVDLVSVNAFSLALAYDLAQMEYVGIENPGTKQMENLTYDRLHTNGTKQLYPTFVNMGEQEPLEGSNTLAIVKFKAKKDFNSNLKATDIILVDKELNRLTY